MCCNANCNSDAAAACSLGFDVFVMIVQMFECVVCDKTYKSEKALKNHEASKKHKEQLKKFKRMMKDEDDLDLNAKAADLQL
jgi:Zinc-finger double-stranded RNA-binding